MNCRFCKSDLKVGVIDLHTSPPSNSYLSKKDLNTHENYYPLKIYFCNNCYLVQTIDYVDKEIMFSEKLFIFFLYIRIFFKSCKNILLKKYLKI